MSDSDSDTTRPPAELVYELDYLTICSARHHGTHTLSLTGEVDLANSSDVEAELLRIEATDATRIVLDLSALEFIGTSGIRLVVAADARSRADTNRLILMRPPTTVLRAFAIAGAVGLPFAD